MNELREIKNRYEKYTDEVHSLYENKGLFDGILGFGNAPSKDPCHMKFYEEIEDMISKISRDEPEPQTASRLVSYLLSARDSFEAEDTAIWMITAAEGLSQSLIPFLDPKDAQDILSDYETRTPKRMRLPVQSKIIKLLKEKSQK